MLLDIYAWIEYFLGSEKGKKVEEFLREECSTSIVSLAEMSEWCFKNNKNFKERLEIIKRFSKILALNEIVVFAAGKINFEHKKIIRNWGMVDSLVYATAKFYDIKILTGDKHFQNLENVIML